MTYIGQVLGLLSYFAVAWIVLLPLAVSVAQAQAPGAESAANRQQQEQLLREQARQRQHQRQMQPPVDVRLEGERRDKGPVIPPEETPCFPIQDISLTGESAARFRFALAKAIESAGFRPGMCLGAQGINVLMTLTQNAAIARGYTTTRILAAPQDLKSGQLAFTVAPGRIHAIRFALDDKARTNAGRIAWRANELPASPGDILNLRDLEQALENLKRVPTAEADIQILPAASPNESDIVIRWRQRTVPWRIMIGLDDGGSRDTGRYQGNVTLFADSLLGLSDIFYASYNHHLFHAPRRDGQDGGRDPESGTQGWSLHYSVPWGNWLLSLNHGAWRYHQAVAGLIENYDYNGKSTFFDAGLTRQLYRDAHRKTSLGAKLWRRESRNYIEETEIDIQHRRTAGWELTLSHKEYLGAGSVNVDLGYRRGTGAGGSRRAPEEDLGEGTSRMKILTADLALYWPFALGKESLAYDGSLHAQWNHTRLVLQDRLAIGGRHTVRGFDGETTFAGERGWYWRNSLSWQYQPAHQLYLGADMGRVWGASPYALPGRLLAGAVAGLKGQFLPGGQIYYDLFIGGPLRKPRHFETESTTLGFTLNYSL